jgi:hypothetical protein
MAWLTCLRPVRVFREHGVGGWASGGAPPPPPPHTHFSTQHEPTPAPALTRQSFCGSTHECVLRSCPCMWGGYGTLLLFFAPPAFILFFACLAACVRVWCTCAGFSRRSEGGTAVLSSTRVPLSLPPPPPLLVSLRSHTVQSPPPPLIPFPRGMYA